MWTIDIAIEGAEFVRAALTMYRRGADVADAIIAATNIAHVCAQTATFDRKAAKVDSHSTIMKSMANPAACLLSRDGKHGSAVRGVAFE